MLDATGSLDYDPDTGSFTWVRCKFTPWLEGRIAGVVHKNGYRYIKLGQKSRAAGSLAWEIMTGAPPPEGKIVDHRDRDKANYRWANLRLATVQQNSANSSRGPNFSGYRGVSKHVGGLWRSRVGDEVKYFKSAVEAAADYNRRASEKFGEFAILNDLEGGNT